MDKEIANIKNYLKIINTNIDEIEKANKDIVDFTIVEVLDRVLLYLNSETIPTKLERILAKIVNTNLIKCLNEIENGTVNQAITSIADNGQSISFANEVKKYFTTTNDEELFSGFTTLLSRYRRVKVVYPENNEE